CNIKLFDIIIIVLAIIRQMIEEFVPPSWINDEDDIADD
ncbi:unnamed protein product, partial [Rotaria magnacalcarata]